MRFAFYSSNLSDPKGYYELNNFPGCSQLIVSNHVTVYPEFRGNGVGKKMMKERIAKAQELGYDYMICTVVATNQAQLRIMEKHGGWKELDSFTNKETGNHVKIMGRRLN